MTVKTEIEMAGSQRKLYSALPYTGTRTEPTRKALSYTGVYTLPFYTVTHIIKTVV